MISSLLAAGLVTASATSALVGHGNNFWTPPTTIEGGTTLPGNTGKFPIEWPSEITYSFNNVPKERCLGVALIGNDFLTATAFKYATEPDIISFGISPGNFWMYDQQGNEWEDKYVFDLKERVTHFTLNFGYIVYFKGVLVPSAYTLFHPISLTIIRDQNK